MKHVYDIITQSNEELVPRLYLLDIERSRYGCAFSIWCQSTADGRLPAAIKL
jgi:hypothetical protein